MGAMFWPVRVECACTRAKTCCLVESFQVLFTRLKTWLVTATMAFASSRPETGRPHSWLAAGMALVARKNDCIVVRFW